MESNDNLLDKHDLARRLEALDAASNVAYAQTKARLLPASGSCIAQIGDGVAVFTGTSSPINRTFGLGMSAAVDDEMLAEAERFFRDRQVALQVDVCPLADLSLFQRLRARGYGAQGVKQVWARSLATPLDLPEASHRIRVERIDAAATDDAVTRDRRRLWARVAAGKDPAAPVDDGDLEIALPTAFKTDTVCYLAWLDDQPAGSAALATREGACVCFAAYVRPALRRLGVQTALFHARLNDAQASGCDLAMVQSTPSSASLGNIQRCGFQLAYVKTMLGETDSGLKDE